MVTRGTAAASLLDIYSPERNDVGEMVLSNATRSTDIATLAHPAAQVMRNLVLRFVLGLHAVQDRIAVTMTETEIAYTDSALSVGARHVPHNLAAGARQDPALYDGPPPGSGDTRRFVLFTADKARGAELMAAFPSVLEAAPRASP